jgi:hypothetical protein
VPTTEINRSAVLHEHKTSDPTPSLPNSYFLSTHLDQKVDRTRVDSFHTRNIFDVSSPFLVFFCFLRCVMRYEGKIVRLFLLLYTGCSFCIRSQQFDGVYHVHPPGRLVTATIRRDTIKGTRVSRGARCMTLDDVACAFWF